MKRLLQITTIFVDYLLLTASIVVVLWSRTPASVVFPIITTHLSIFLPLFIGWIAVFGFFSLYDFNFPLRIARLFFAILINTLWSSLVFYFFPVFIITPKTNMALLAVVAIIVISIWHRIVDYIFVSRLHGHEIMIAISDEHSYRLARMLVENPRHKYRVLGVLASEEFASRAARLALPKAAIYDDLKKFEEAFKASGAQTIVCSDLWFTKLYASVYAMLPKTLSMTHVISFYERVFRYIPVQSANEYWMISNMDVVGSRAYAAMKRVMDLVFAILIFPIFLPLGIFTALCIKLFGGRGPFFFTQERVGQNNKLFTLIKFRTMHIDAEKDGEKWAVKNDPRVTRLGKFLRMTRIDEIPQIINVIKGDMSFIGPRPERMVFVKKLVEKIPHYQLRHMIKPGLSGWAQVNYRYTSTVEDTVIKVSYDMYYVKRMSFFLDVHIFFKTLATVLTARGQ